MTDSPWKNNGGKRRGAGQPPKYTYNVAQILRLRKKKLTYKQIAKTINIESWQAVRYVCISNNVRIRGTNARH